MIHCHVREECARNYGLKNPAPCAYELGDFVQCCPHVWYGEFDDARLTDEERDRIEDAAQITLAKTELANIELLERKPNV